MNALAAIQARFRIALGELSADPTPLLALIKPAQDSKFGDYQANLAMSLGKQLGRPPREVAAEVVKRLDLGDLLEPPEVAGPGFINLRLRADWIAGRVLRLVGDDRLGIAKVGGPRNYVVDFSSVNVAKPLHVGHLRSTIIGDSLSRTLRFLGHRVVTDNHLGDWGTQFGILLYGYKHLRDDAAYRADPVRELARIYVQVRDLSKGAAEDEGKAPDPEAKRVADECRAETAKLHRGDPENVRLWQEFMPACMAEIEPLYRRLGVSFDHQYGESFYNPMLPGVVEDLLAKGVARSSDGAVGIFSETDPEASPSLVQKRDGAFTYTTTDLATIRYRLEHFQADACVYVVDARQALHFANLFKAARRWGVDKLELTHVSFGSVLGLDRKPLKTRDGNVPELGALIEEAVARAATVYAELNSEEASALTATERQQIAETVGIGAVKYADLSQHRATDYVFAWDKLLAMDGNTAAYMQYAYARCRSIIGKADAQAAAPTALDLTEPHERALALKLLQFDEALASTVNEYLPHVITAYLWDLAKSYSGFFQNCPVLKAATPALQAQRLVLCDLTARTIRLALDLLGIGVVERM